MTVPICLGAPRWTEAPRPTNLVMNASPAQAASRKIRDSPGHVDAQLRTCAILATKANDSIGMPSKGAFDCVLARVQASFHSPQGPCYLPVKVHFVFFSAAV